MGANVYKEHNLSNFLQKEVPMGSETCLKNSNEWCSLTFRAKKSCLRLNLRVLRASWRKHGVLFRIRALVASSLSSCGSDMDSVWQNYGRFSEHLSILWQSLKVLHFLMRFLPDCPKYLVLYSGDIVSTYILTDARNALLFLAFTRMSYSMPSSEKSRIRHIAAEFSSIYGQIRLPGS